MWLSRDAFARVVADALDVLPDDVHGWLENVEVLVDDWPTRAQLGGAGGGRRGSLLGLYEGIPLTERGADYGMVEPDRITIFRGPVLDRCRTEIEVRDEVRQTVIHELAHHFGIDDDRLEALGAY
jgi:predicted Zn-dependent protease with MMP-like domain